MLETALSSIGTQPYTRNNGERLAGLRKRVEHRELLGNGVSILFGDIIAYQI
jgi:hypothetical protein